MTLRPAHLPLKSSLVVVDCLCPAMVITADDALLCQAVTSYPLNYHLSEMGREGEGSRGTGDRGRIWPSASEVCVCLH